MGETNLATNCPYHWTYTVVLYSGERASVSTFNYSRAMEKL